MELRPNKLSDIVGQIKVKQCLSILINAYRKNYGAVGHILFEGCAGYGKTTLATTLANELGVTIHIANGGNLRSIKNVLPYIAKLKQNQVLFIDEIHRISPVVMEFLYPVMEDFRADAGGEEGVSFAVSPFTMIGATTEAGMLSKPLQDRFIHKFTLDKYSKEDIIALASRNVTKLGLNITNEAMMALADRCRGVPRILNSYLIWLSKYAMALPSKTVTLDAMNTAMELINVDKDGLTASDHIYLTFLRTQKKPVGIKTLVGATELSQQSIEHNVEPFLMQKGLIVKTARGRMINGC